MQCSDETRYCISHGKYFVEKKIILRGFDLKKSRVHTQLLGKYDCSNRTHIADVIIILFFIIISRHMVSDGYGFDVGTVDVCRYDTYACEQNYRFYTRSTVYLHGRFSIYQFATCTTVIIYLT